MVFVDNILRRDPFLTGLDGDRHPVFVRTAHRNHIGTPQTQVTGIDVRRDIHPGQMADMNGPVGIRQGRSNQITFVLFHE